MPKDGAARRSDPSRSLPQHSDSVTHTTIAVLKGATEPKAATALDCALAPKSISMDDAVALSKLRRELRKSTELQDCSRIDAGDDPDSFKGPEPAAEKKSFRSRRLSTETVGVDKANDGKATTPPPRPVATVTGAAAAAASTAKSAFSMRGMSKDLPTPASGGRLMVAKEYEDIFVQVRKAGAAGPGAAWALSPGIDSNTIGLLSCHGAEPADSGAGGQFDKINQDCGCVASCIGGDAGTAIFCVYDGHGDRGRDVSQYAMHAMYKLLDEKHAELLHRRPQWALATAFNEVQEELRNPPPKAKIDATQSGACALVTYIRDHTLWVAGAGDTRAVLGTVTDGLLAAIALSTDHKVDVPNEAQRIRAAGGHIKPSCPPAPARLYADAKRLNPGLAIARALGDTTANAFGMIPTPEVVTHKIQPEDRFLILASDGVWEFIGANEAVEIVDAFISQGKGVSEACHHLIATAAEAWLEVEGDYRDDITACIVLLQPVVEALDKNRAESGSLSARAVKK